MICVRWGWSDGSHAEAVAHGEARANEALDGRASGKPFVWHESRPYVPTDGMPICEERVAEEGRAIVTRNGYGALVLNVPDVVFADVDDRAPRENRTPVVRASLLGMLAAILVRQAGHGVAVMLVAAILTAATLLFIRAMVNGALARRGREALREDVLDAAERFAKARKTRRVEVYETPAGFRLMLTHARFAVDAPETKAFFEAVGADPKYTALCELQGCYRARLTPKPWRLSPRMRPPKRLAYWPLSERARVERDAWVRDYDAASSGYAACRYVRGYGDGREDPDVARVRALHDRHCRAHESSATLA